MGSYDRDYLRYSDNRREYFMSGGPFSHLPPASRFILIINIGAFILTMLPFIGPWMIKLFSVFPMSYSYSAQLWRLITYQFLHGDPLHIFFNMLVFYYLGPFIEGLWGTRTFIRFYLLSGLVGGVVYTLLVLLRVLPAFPLVGASGAIYGLIAAYAVLYPRSTMYWFFIIPMRTMTLLMIVVVWSVLNFLAGQNAGGEAAHLSGIAVGIFYVTLRPRMVHWRMERSKGAWKQKLEQEQRFHSEVDQILDKVHKQGIASLTSREKEILREATRREQKEDAKLSKHL